MALKEMMLKSQRALTVAQIAALLSVSERQVYKHVQTGEIPHFKVGASVRFDPLLISNWMEQQTAAHPGLPLKKTNRNKPNS